MTKQEFLTDLQRTLNGRMGSREAMPHVSYYQEYIEIEVRKGKKEEDVISELGSPRLIGKSVADAFDRKNRKNSYGKWAAEYGSILLKYGLTAGRKYAGLGVMALKKTKEWFKKL